MFCKNCGKEVDNNADVCVHCGKAIDKAVKVVDNGSIGWGILGFLFPLIGLILYLVWKEDKPKSSKVAGKGALIGVIASVVIYVIYFVVIIPIIANTLVYY